MYDKCFVLWQYELMCACELSLSGFGGFLVGTCSLLNRGNWLKIIFP